MPSGSEEINLVRAAAAGDGPAFAGLYEAYERRIFNYLLRLLGDRHEAEDATQEAFIRVVTKLPELDPDDLQFGPYLYTAARNAGYDVIAKRKRMEPTGAVPQGAEAPFRGDLPELESDPERAVLADSQDAAVRAANQKLPERQREVLSLRELDGMSYDEIGSVMDMKPNAVAQLISRARIGLRKEMRAGAAASVALTSADCERAHGELACRQDDQSRGFDDQWLDAHLALCSNCRVASEEMAEAGVSYRAWAPVVPAAWLFREVMARASEVSGHDWTGVERKGGELGGASRANHGKRAALVGFGSALVAVFFAVLLLAEADAPQREGPVREALVREEAEPKPAAGKQKKGREGAPAERAVQIVEEGEAAVSTVPVTMPSSQSEGGNRTRPADSAGGGTSGPSRPPRTSSPPRTSNPPNTSRPDPPPVLPDPVPDVPPRPVPEPEPDPPVRPDPPRPCVPGTVC